MWQVVLGLVLQASVAPLPVSAQAAGTPPRSSTQRTVVAGAHYRAGWLHRLLLGAHYRDLWTTPLDVEVLDLSHFAGGLTPQSCGGRRQTKALRFLGADGREYVFRSVDKDPTLALPPELRATFARDIIQDQISSAHPGGPLDYESYWRVKGGSAVAVHDVGDRELAKQYGIVDVDADDRIVGFVEKPADPPSTLSATATYLYTRSHAALVGSYLDEGNPSDQPGHFVGWLYQREPVYAYRIAGAWYDIGDADQLLEADNRLRALAGLPLRNAYFLD